MDVENIIHILKKAPRYFNPTLGNTVVITEEIAADIIEALAPKAVKKETLTLKNATHGAKPA